MLNLLSMLLLLGFCIAVLMLVRRRVLSQRRDDLAALAAASSDAEAVVVGKVLRTLRSRNLAALGAAAFGAAVAIFFTEAFPRTYGLLMVAAPAIMAVLAAAVYAFWRIPHEFPTADPAPSGRISADLTPRSTGMFGPAWGIVLPGVLLIGTLGGLLVAGMFSGPDEKGLYRDLPYVSMNGAQLDENSVVTQIHMSDGSTGPFPGWYYGLPVMGLLVIAGILTLWALNVNARRPRLRSTGLQGFDHAVRTHNGYVLSTGLSALLCFQAVPLVVLSASSIVNAGYNTMYAIGQVYDDDAIPDSVLDPAHAALAMSLAGVGLLLGVTGVLLLANLVGWIGATIMPIRRKSIESATA
ncbi:hypothetical protein ACFY5D_18170 [Paeniglutamicibacter sp. NPDC012692]|uniref:hypothetical protein n=1 Tax=Paeniglutamicibacter sp. NPDC012692 TaxID=3364388 RepID=UPI0036C7D4BB